MLLGDVSGHGRESVTQAALARYTLRTLLAAGTAGGGAGARRRAARARAATQLRDGDRRHLRPRDRRADLREGRHAPPIVLGTAHDPDAEEPAPPLGLGVDETWPEYRVRLGEGVSVCLFTDGPAGRAGGRRAVGRDEVERCSRPTTSPTPAG